MGIPRRRDNALLGSVRVASRFITVPTAPYTTVTLTSANAGAFMYNVGTPTLLWGGSNVAVNSGAFLYPSTGFEWLNTEDAFTFYVIADSVAGTLCVNEYGLP